MTDADLADRVEEWLHGRELQYATIKLMADVIYALRRSQPEGDYVIVRKEVVEFLRGAAPLDGQWFGEGRGYWWRSHLTAIEAEGRKP